MKNIPTNPDRFSYFLKPIGNIIPCRMISLETVYHFISMEYLASVTQKVRSGQLKKYLALPFITASGVFKRRSMDYISSYSGIVSIDLDHVEIKLKEKLFEDPFLQPKLVFVSPSKKGLKLFIKVKNPSAVFHDHYFNAISLYLLDKFELKSDPACRDITRACFLCHDPEALYSPLGSVDSETLLNMIPPRPCTDEQLYIAPDPVDYNRVNRFDGLPCEERDAPPCVSTTFNVANAFSRRYYRKSAMVYLMDKLNTCPQVHDYAISVLKQNGWRSKGKYWIRPGKDPKEGHSAVFSYFQPYGIYLFTNFSDKAQPFSANKSYSDCMIIATLAYNSDYRKCIDELMSDFSA